MATAKSKISTTSLRSSEPEVTWSLDELQKLAKYALGVADQPIIEQLIYPRMPPHLKKSIKQAYLENGSYEQIVTHLEKELELNSLEALYEIQINSVT